MQITKLILSLYNFMHCMFNWKINELELQKHIQIIINRITVKVNYRKYISKDNEAQ